MSKALAPEAANMARSKFEELKKLIEQRQQINLELIGKLAKALEKVKAGAATAGVNAVPAAASKQPAAKRSSQPASFTGPDPKRPKLDSETDKKIQDIWRMCGAVLDFLMKKKNAIVFLRPVDPVKDGVPDYFKFICHPMDLGTIKTRLRERKYSDPREFAADVRLVWRNCATYNAVGTPVRIMGDQLSEDWERKWAELNVEQRWDALVATRDPQTIPLDQRIASSARQLLQRVNSVHVLPDADPSRTMTTVEKRKLSIALSELQGNQLADVLNIIAENLKDINPDDEEEIELDVDQLDNQTLWRLREYCDNANNKHSAKPTAPSKAGGGGASRSVHDNGKPHVSKPAARTESGSESDRYSAEQDVKGSNMVEQPQSNGVKLTGQAQPLAGSEQGDGDVALGEGNTEAAAADGMCEEPQTGPVPDDRQVEEATQEKSAEEDAEEDAQAEGAEEDANVAKAEEDGEVAKAEDDGEVAKAEEDGEVAKAEEDGEVAKAEEDGEVAKAADDGEDAEGGQGRQADPDAMEADGEGGTDAIAMATDAEEPSDAEAGRKIGGEEAADLNGAGAGETGQPNFVKNQRTAIPVDESATAPKDKSAIATDKKSNKDVVLNASAWQAADEEAEGGGEATEAGPGGEEDGDDLWDSFRSVAEREKQQKAEEEKRRKELEQERERERLRVVAEARQAKEEEERKMREAEEAAAAEAKRAKDEARQKELEELQMQANTAQVYQPPDAKAFSGTFGASGADINDLGLMYKHDDDADDVNFDD
ncbi:hypothetical protein VOLCADRAFT_104017 [Volvox carteri f. nagariensis]|uniref:Uncharacterized protein n=1 Tax=Volvox carteri f. nagariensis TaxID=3068 RepID=D8TQQ1_VOLCA|nr:uncharacterized protein VOLCADRAFT_104017 [Volvox carteri f. nagariensis]EFJ50191.1 hypothetical protein VOLCADRAFT_104017 [Volvox carteri f. nagariensis]|eukprot:XP_002948811.1 hypothetical protein VOLCADRAFT_104017 [Volvox carteri f. nagariensis]